MAFKLNLPPQRNTRGGDSILANKASMAATKNPGEVKLTGGANLYDRIASIKALVESKLGKYADDYLVIRDDETFLAYIRAAIKTGEIAIDTETTGLNLFHDVIAGTCLYYPGGKACYVPHNHVSYVTMKPVKNQISIEALRTAMIMIRDSGVKTIFHNAKFDIRVIYHATEIWLDPYWCTQIASKLLNENEDDHKLKHLHNKYCLGGLVDSFTFDELFRGIPFTLIPISVGYLYAAHDPIITYELCKFQERYLTPGTPECTEQELEGPAYIMRDREMPLVIYVAEMEETGIALNLERQQSLSIKYHKLLDEANADYIKELTKFEAVIKQYQMRMGINNKLEYPINAASSSQLAIFFYDILGLKSPDKEKPRGTGAEILETFDNVICKKILAIRTIEKLLGTYIDKMPDIAVDGRIHCSFNQYGTATGRFSSNDPNMQNIPSHNAEIRTMFKATDGYVLIGSDYSGQEVRLTACLANDLKMIKAYQEGQDIYSAIAAIAFNMPYDECVETRVDGTKSKDGKERRGKAKAIVLGILYGKGIPAIAADLKVTKAVAQEIYDAVLKNFPATAKFIEESLAMAHQKGYVTTFWGRKRRLPDIQLPKYEFTMADNRNFDVLAFDGIVDDEVDPYWVKVFSDQLDNCWSAKGRRAIKEKALAQGIKIKENGGFIAQAERQAVNARVQGSAADLTKKAMIMIGRHKRLRAIGGRMLLTVHDEIIIEAPIAHAKEAGDILAQCMLDAGSDLCVPLCCDAEYSWEWYGDSLDPVTLKPLPKAG